jgi:hypothetical protein
VENSQLELYFYACELNGIVGLAGYRCHNQLRMTLLYTVQKEQVVRLVSLMQREIILYMASAICVSSYLADFYLLTKFASLE